MGGKIMSQRINVRPQEMGNMANQVRQQAEEWQGFVSNSKQNVRAMDAMWEGLGNATFNNIWQQHEQQFVQLRNLMTTYYNAITAAAQRYTEAENQVQGIVRRGH
jgi:WXG100 family type VII secretion target